MLTASAEVVTVSNTSNVIDGNVTSISALMLSPGADGVSFVEAMAAANATSGPKAIRFAPALAGRTIHVGNSGSTLPRALPLLSGDLTIDGDVDGNGTSDVSFDASPTGAQLTVRSSNNVIANQAAPALSDMTWTDIAITDNDVQGLSSAISVYAGSSGARRNRVSRVTIARNRLQADIPIAIIAADANSAWHTGAQDTGETDD